MTLTARPISECHVVRYPFSIINRRQMKQFDPLPLKPLGLHYLRLKAFRIPLFLNPSYDVSRFAFRLSTSLLQLNFIAQIPA